jgi:hypothetical protein
VCQQRRGWAGPHRQVGRCGARTFGGGAPFHILSGEPIPVEQQSDAARALRPTRPMADYRPSLVRRRAVDITSNEYLVSAASRVQRMIPDVARRARKLSPPPPPPPPLPPPPP